MVGEHLRHPDGCHWFPPVSQPHSWRPGGFRLKSRRLPLFTAHPHALEGSQHLLSDVSRHLKQIFPGTSESWKFKAEMTFEKLGGIQRRGKK